MEAVRRGATKAWSTALAPMADATGPARARTAASNAHGRRDAGGGDHPRGLVAHARFVDYRKRGCYHQALGNVPRENVCAGRKDA